jgi:Protein of unknown function (DUF1761)
MERKTNWLAIVACVILGMGLGFLWYGALFQQQWMAGNGMTMQGEKVFKNGVEMPTDMTPMLVQTVSTLIFALLTNWLLGLTKANNWMDGAKIGGTIGLITFLSVLTGNMFAGNPMSLTMVDGSFNFVLFLLFGAVLGGWQKR